MALVLPGPSGNTLGLVPMQCCASSTVPRRDGRGVAAVRPPGACCATLTLLTLAYAGDSSHKADELLAQVRQELEAVLKERDAAKPRA